MPSTKNSTSKLRFLSSRPNTHNSLLGSCLKFFYHLASSSLASFLLVCRLLYLGTSIRRDIANLHTPHNGAGTVFLLIVVVHVRRYDYASFTMSPPRHSSFSSPIPGFMMLSPSPHHVLLPLVCLQHLPLLSCCLCLYPCMCIPYSISRCSLTLYGAHAGLCCCSCQSSLYDFAVIVMMPSVVSGVIFSYLFISVVS